ncbi:MAG: serine protease [Candidatus Omnitrophica bacterium]|nr:serine protease [Candidatus Omnitrophota bacterium]
MKKKKKFLFSILILTTATVYSQSSSLIALEKTRESIVYIESEIQTAYKDKPFLIKNPNGSALGLVRPVRTGKFRRVGTGVIISESGIIVTNAHTVNKATRILVATSDKKQFQAQLLFQSKTTDLAFLAIAISGKKLKPVHLADSDKISLNDKIYTITSSQFISGTISQGRVTGLGEKTSPDLLLPYRYDLIKTNLNIYQGDSGSAIFDKSGNLLGILTSAETNSPYGSFAISSNRIAYAYMVFLSNNQK